MPSTKHHPDLFLPNWRYWPMELLYLPLTLYIFFVQSIRNRHLFFFAAANPGVTLGGFAGDSKSAILEHVPRRYKPKTWLVRRGDDNLSLLEHCISAWFSFPLIVKPDIGEGGFLVQKIDSMEDWRAYHLAHNMDYIVQEYISLPLEVSISIQVIAGRLQISAVTEKRYLTLIGDGHSTVAELLKTQQITRKAKRRLRLLLHDQLDDQLLKGETLQPTAIGNWHYGTTFHHRPDWNTEGLRTALEKLNDHTGLFNYARYDIKCVDSHSLEKGSFLVLEINGVKGEPIHIYDSENTLWNAYREIFRHWRMIAIISRQNLHAGENVPTMAEGFRILRRHKQQLKSSLKPR